jgi:kojibiose phosphorylase
MRSLLESFTLTPDPRWQLEIEGFDRGLEPSIEAVAALVNGYLGTRAAVEEGSPVSRPGTFIAGVFNTPAKPQVPELEAPIPEMVVAPDWAQVRISVGGAELRLDQVELLSQRRVLDLRQGVLLREWRVRDAAGQVTSLRSLRFASLAERHLCVQALSLTPENYRAPVRLEALVDARVANENHTRHLATTGIRPVNGGALLTARTVQSGYLLAYASQATLNGWSATAPDDPQRLQRFLAEGAILQSWEWLAEPGHTYELQKIVVIVTSRETPEPATRAGVLLQLATEAALDQLLVAHAAAWAERWESCDIELDGDDEIQREVRFALYHLVGAANPHDDRASVGARALTGERYRGHVFWDTEIFVWPFFLYTHPLTARSLLMYRYRALAGARAKARTMGYRGALYPWEATDTGDETTPPFVINPAGERLAILTGIEEHHIAADVAYAVHQYRQAAGDEIFFRECGAEIMLDVAVFWASRAVPGEEGRYHIQKVIGPDEYHESVDDSAFTNMIAAWCLRQGLAIADEFQRTMPAHWQALAARLGLGEAELARWRQVAGGLVTGFDPGTGVFEQFAGYFQLDEYDLSDHDTAVATLDVKLGWAKLQTLQAIKQADIVMLIYLLWDSLAPGVREANFRFYEPRTTHDSSLSPSIHALVTARLGHITLAERYLRQAARIDLDFSRKGWAGATGGVHIAALGGIWQALVFGFLGMRPQAEGVRFDAHLPPHWERLCAPVEWRGRRLRITATQAGIEVTVEHGAPLALAIGDGPWQMVGQGETLRRGHEHKEVSQHD